MDQERSLGSPVHSGNPWQGFAHAEHKSEEFDPLLRTLRFASIQLNKFWVEFNAFPVFMNEMKGASIRQIERLFDWFQAAPSWSAKVGLPRLVPELHAEASRARLAEFAGRVVRVRMLRSGLAQAMTAGLATPAELATALTRMEAAERLTKSLALESGRLAEVDALIQDVSERLERNGKIQAFFAKLATDCALGSEAGHVGEASRVFQAADLIRNTPLHVWQWRRPQCLAAQNRVRILAWQERSVPLLEARRRLEPCFKMEERVAAAQLRLLSEKLLAGGWLRAFKSDYKEALKRYRELLKLEKGAKPPKETPAEMAARLSDWASYLERRAQIEDGAEAKALFAPHFKGIDTHFDAALETNAWALTIRSELESEDKGAEADFCSRLAESLFMSPQAKLLQAVEMCSGASLQAIQAVLARPEYASGGEFAAIGCEQEARWMAASELRGHLLALGFHAETKLSDLEAIHSVARDLLAQLKSIDAQPEPKSAFKHAFAGEHTDLGLLDSAQDYIDFVLSSGLSDGLKASFLTAHGPQRLQDTRALVAPALAGLAHVKEHLRKLEASTHGQSRQLEELPLLDLIQRIQLALKQPGLLAESVGQLQRR